MVTLVMVVILLESVCLVVWMGCWLVFGVIGLAPLGSASLLHSSGEKPPCCQLDDGRPTVRRP